MAQVIFDCLVPTAEIPSLKQRCELLLSRLIEYNKVGEAQLRAVEQNPALLEGVEKALRDTYAEQHEGRELANAEVIRMLMHIERPAHSLNGLVMVLSRLFTPAATLPRDPAALENEMAFELPARYPWTVQVHP
ncbi:hypothetical protein [Corynebacterium sp. TAE3-ERU2]|uniref:hypothetical protein n=1 Tax=Corynebacterium sp. TAE3-ERU2 TaxID=2849497 RepID=UPI001C493248|nr:hypothetical protein [Corynebacterium sp. TAE3-ERU2]MBV7301758.1 hypothetical protein [Corynebacterium sp. TAE3-ERU2]